MKLQHILQTCLEDWKNISGLDFCLLDEKNRIYVSTCDRKQPSLQRLSMKLQHILQTCLEDWKNISGLDFCLLDEKNRIYVSTCDRKQPSLQRLSDFRDSSALCISNTDCGFYKILENEQLLYILIVWGKAEAAPTIGELAVCQINSLITAYAEKNDKNTFMQNVLLERYPQMEIFNRAKKLHISTSARRGVFLVETHQHKDENALATIRNQINSLITAYAEKNDKNTFMQNVLLERYPQMEIFNRAKKLHISTSARRGVFLVETHQHKDENALATIRNIFSARTRDFITAVDDSGIIVIRELQPSEGIKELENIACMLVDMLNTEAMTPAWVSYSNIAEDINHLAGAYKEARQRAGKYCLYACRYVKYRSHDTCLGILQQYCRGHQSPCRSL